MMFFTFKLLGVTQRFMIWFLHESGAHRLNRDKRVSKTGLFIHSNSFFAASECTCRTKVLGGG